MNLLQLKRKDTLPNKLSELLFLAIKDVHELKDNPKYAFNMFHWHNNKSTFADECLICFAGAVMANTFTLPTGIKVIPDDFINKRIGSKLKAIDYLRMLDHVDAYLHLTDLNSSKIKDYDGNIRKVNAADLSMELDHIIDKYIADTEDIDTEDDITEYAHEHTDFYYKYARLLQSVGL